MDPTPHSSRSQKFPRVLNHQSDLEYQASDYNHSTYQPENTLQGSGLYTNSMIRSSYSPNMAFSGLETTSQSIPNTSSSWRAPMLQNRDMSASRRTVPNLLPAEYDPYAPYHSSNISLSSDMYSTSVMDVAAPCIYPLPSGNTSQRSSVSSAPLSDIITQAGSAHSYTPRIKMEEPTDFSAGSNNIILSAPHLSQTLLGESSTFSGVLDQTYYQEQTQIPWSKVDYTNLELPSISALPFPRYERRSESQERIEVSPSAQRRPSNTIARTRQPRRLTTKEEANFQCNVKGCGKLFGRSYNYKAHMETHDATREYPFPCTQPDCEKKFVRKTDLQRHHQSVHMKQRNFRCDYCDRMFARKDTLRRHMEDGCSKRFDIEVVDYQPQNSEQHEPDELRNTLQPEENDHGRRLTPYDPSITFPHQSSTLSSHLPTSNSHLSNSALFSGQQDYLPLRDGSAPGWHS